MDSSSAVDRGRDLVASAASLAVTGKNASLAPTEPTHTPVEGASRENAAGRIQRTYRGHRTRRELKGFGLDASTRWTEVVKDARYQSLINPVPSFTLDDSSHNGTRQSLQSSAREKWRRVGDIARHANTDDLSPPFSDLDPSDEDHGSTSDTTFATNTTSTINLDPAVRLKHREQRASSRAASAKTMDLQYFLEMVDVKHRYGSNLRAYHNRWKQQDTKQNFFYWLDYGEGRDFELPDRSRARLEKEQVRYLSKEERLQYLVYVDDEGRLRWAKNRQRIWTSDELYRDSMKGIVPVDDVTPEFRSFEEFGGDTVKDADSSSDTQSEEMKDEQEKAERYANPETDQSKGLKKMTRVSPAVIFNHLISNSTRKGNKWIFVADTSFRIYVGVKDSGAFQHSSFLHGSRIAAAGLIKIKDGQLRTLSPHSGHYRPQTANFRAFVHSLKTNGVDMSRISIPKSYAVLVSIEGYSKTRKQVKAIGKAVAHRKDM